MPRNRLAEETSPYLLQHADNPVAWMPWGNDALGRARAEDKPILLSVGYAACHWCHVMAHESFEDQATADVMNDLFVNIKVDREERPDLDAIYQTALAVLGQQGGWPLTMFLTPAGEPFWGGTYFPKEPRFGRPAFTEVLRTIADVYRREPERVTKNVGALHEALEQVAANRPAGLPRREVLDHVAERLLSAVDTVHGGLNGAPKFPQTSILLLLWRAWRRTGEEGYRDAVTLALTRMCQGGIYDHLGGGFARYSVDAAWLVPHFEKMLYDNAQLVEALTLVWQETRDPLYEVRVRETIGWVLREMIAEGGGFASTLDADSEGEEGRFYVWTEAEIDAVLGDDAPLFKEVYDVRPGGNWEGKTILNRGQQAGLADPETEARLAGLRDRLFRARAGRVRPGWDDKVLADWNGLMIAALAEAALVFDEPDWQAAAARAFAFVRDRMTVDGRLHHAWRLGEARHLASLDDHAAMARAALALFEADGDPLYLDQARAWAETVHAHYWDEANDGYFFTADDAENLIVRTKSVYDNATPSGNGMMVEVLARLFYLTGRDEYRARCEALIGAFSGELMRNFFPLSTFLNGLDLFTDALQVVVVGDRADSRAAALLDAVLDRSLPNRLLTTIPAGAALPPGHPAAGKGQVDGKPTAYVCRGVTCQAPVTEPTALVAQLPG